MNKFIVDNLNDNGAGSLRQAIVDANNTNGIDEIQFARELDGREIVLTSGELEISDSVYIRDDNSNVIINGNNASRIFTVDDFNESNQIDVVIDGLTLTGGSSSQGGGAIANSENLTIYNSNITNNENTSLEATDGGGAIRNSDTGSLNVYRSLIAENRSTAFGGGITNFGELNVKDSWIFDNEVTGGGGAGIDNRGSTADITGSFIIRNTNTANPAGGFGNGTPDSTTVVTDTVIAGNQAVDGAGFFVNAGNVEIVDSLIFNNQAQNNGGGTALAEGANLNIDNSLIIFNSAEVNGGGIANLGGSVTPTRSIVFGNEAFGNAGGIFNQGDSLDLDSNFVIGNTPNNVVEV